MVAKPPKTLLILGIGLLGCAAALALGSGVFVWFKSPPTDVKPAEDKTETKVEDELSSNEIARSVERDVQRTLLTEADLPVEASIDSLVEMRLANLGYEIQSFQPPWMPEFPQAVTPASLWRNIKYQETLSSDSQVGLCLVRFDSDYRWDPLNGAPDPYLRVSHNNDIILEHQQSNIYSAYFSFWRSRLTEADIFSFELYDYDALNKNDFVASWAFALTDLANYAHFVDKSSSECRFLSQQTALEEAQQLVASLDVAALLRGTPSAGELHFGFLRTDYLEIQRQIEGVAALLGVQHATVVDLLEQEKTGVRQWVKAVTPVLQAALQDRQGIQHVRVGGWEVGLRAFECNATPFCRLDINLKPEQGIDLATVERREPLKIMVIDQMGVEHSMTRERYVLNGTPVSEYDLKEKSVPVSSEDALSVKLSLPCRDCDGLAEAIRSDVRLVRVYLNGDSELISVR